MVFESDDWGMCGVRDIEALDRLRGKGYYRGQDIRSYYSLETTEDLEKLYDTLTKHRDSKGDHPVFTSNFIVTNPDFERIRKSGYQSYFHQKLSDGFPPKWKRRRLFGIYMDGINIGVVHPGYHGREHFNYRFWLKLLQSREPSTMDAFQEEMVFAHFKYNRLKDQYIDCSTSPAKFLDHSIQSEVISDGVSIFRQLFGRLPVTTIAPSYFWNDDTERAWAGVGIKFIQGGNLQNVETLQGYRNRIGYGRKHLLGGKNQYGMLYLTRNVDFEPWDQPLNSRRILDRIDMLFAMGAPVIISTHSLNYTSAIWNFRDRTLAQLDYLLTAIEAKYPDLLYLSDAQLGDAILNGYFTTHNDEKVHIHRRSVSWDNPGAVAKMIYYTMKHRLM